MTFTMQPNDRVLATSTAATEAAFAAERARSGVLDLAEERRRHRLVDEATQTGTSPREDLVEAFGDAAEMTDAWASMPEAERQLVERAVNEIPENIHKGRTEVVKVWGEAPPASSPKALYTMDGEHITRIQVERRIPMKPKWVHKYQVEGAFALLTPGRIQAGAVAVMGIARSGRHAGTGYVVMVEYVAQANSKYLRKRVIMAQRVTEALVGYGYEPDLAEELIRRCRGVSAAWRDAADLLTHGLPPTGAALVALTSGDPVDETATSYGYSPEALDSVAAQRATGEVYRSRGHAPESWDPDDYDV
jgi:hypothetical protein